MRPDICPKLSCPMSEAAKWGGILGQDRTHPLRVSVCPVRLMPGHWLHSQIDPIAHRSYRTSILSGFPSGPP